MSVLKKIFVIFMIFMLPACSILVSGYKNKPYQMDKIQVNETTFKQVMSIYGSPAYFEVNEVVRATYFFKTPESDVNISEMRKGSYIDGCKKCGKLVLAFDRKEGNVLRAYATTTKALDEKFTQSMKLLNGGLLFEARTALEQLASQHYADAEFNLGLMNVRGDGGAVDYARARQLFYNAAITGHVSAMYDLGAMYNNGEGGERDRVRAKGLFAEAANRGHIMAAGELAKIYAEEGDTKKAAYWWDIVKKSQSKSTKPKS